MRAFLRGASFVPCSALYDSNHSATPPFQMHSPVLWCRNTTRAEREALAFSCAVASTLRVNRIAVDNNARVTMCNS